ncbi:MAG: T9SS type A sorting domain-containing protein, partial [Rhodothermales bacterium]
TTSLEVGAPTLTNAAFSVLPSSALVVPPGETVVYSISFAPAENGVYEGLLELTTVDAGAVTIPLLGLTELNQLAFSLSESSGGESEKDIPVDIRLTFSNADHNLQGIQLSLSWDDDILSLADVLPGLAVAASNWTLSYSVTGSSVKVLLFDETGVGLPAGYYDPIVSLRFDAGLLNNGERDVTLALDEVIGALAVPTADDAELIPWGPDHVLTIEKRFAYFSVDVPDVSFGMVPAGTSVQKSFVVSNLDGERTFDVMALAFIDGPFSVEPGSASIQPDESVEFTVTFEPTLTDFGFFEVDLAIEHDAETDGEYLLPVAGIGIYGRGDNDGDGMVDAMDVIRTVDFILDRTEPTPLQLSLSDIFPFVAGDGTLDVRDLAVTVQGIVRGVWPDDVSPPATYDPEAVTVASKRQSPSSPVRVTVRDEAEQILLNVENDVPLRALQLHLMVQFASGAPRLLLNRDGSPTASGRGEVDVETGIVRVLLYRPDGGVIQPGSYIFAEVPRTASGQVQRLYATAIGQENDRLAVEISGLTAISAPQDDLPRHFSVGQPFPNPFSSGSGGVLRIPVRVPGRSSVELSVYDILGRRVALSSAVVTGNAEIQWDASSSSGGIPPGVYLLRIAVDDRVTTRKIVVTR